jgi:hypothetical protein
VKGAPACLLGQNGIKDSFLFRYLAWIVFHIFSFLIHQSIMTVFFSSLNLFELVSVGEVTGMV